MLFFLLQVVLVTTTFAVDKSKFRTCQHTGFCKRYRNHQPASHVSSNFEIQKKYKWHCHTILILPLFP